MEDTTTGTSTATTIASPAPAAASAVASGTIAPAERPTFAQAFASDAALHAPDSRAQPEAATTQPAETTDAQATLNPSTDKAPPQETWPKILENARIKERAAVQAETDRDYGWMKAAPRENWERMAQIATELNNPPEFLEKYFAEAVAHPTHGAKVKSWAARALSTRVPQAEAMPAPDVQIVGADGQTVTGMTYSDKQLAARDAWTKKQLLAEVGQQLAPFQQEREERQAEQKRQVETQRQEALAKQQDTIADQTVAKIDRILDKNVALYAHVQALIDAGTDPIDAALEVREKHIAPQLEGNAQKKVLDTLQTKAAAQGMNPSSASPSTNKRPTSFLDKSLSWS